MLTVCQPRVVSLGVRYQSKNRLPAPDDSIVTENGTLRNIKGSTEPEVITRLGGKRRLAALANTNTREQKSTASGANFAPTDAIPSVANRLAL
jgi:hypothetical protein